jgi:hypothetical protein
MAVAFHGPRSRVLVGASAGFLLAVPALGENAPRNSAQTAAAPSCELGFPATIDGLLYTRREFGPPGWGEQPATDARWTMAVLVPSKASKKLAVSLLAPCVDRVIVVNEIQLWFPIKDNGWKKLVRRHVRVIGSLHFAEGATAELLELQFDVATVVEL